MVWLEEYRQKEELIDKLLDRLGLTKEAYKNNIQIDEIPSDRLETALGNLGLDDGTKEKLLDWARNNKKGSLTNLVAQISFADLDQQDTSDSQPAKLPPGQGQAPKPMNPALAAQQQDRPMPGMPTPGGVV